jgi:hypothetical protein
MGVRLLGEQAHPQRQYQPEIEGKTKPVFGV